MSSSSSISTTNLSFDHESLFKDIDNELEHDCEKLEEKKRKSSNKTPTTPTYRAQMQILQLKVMTTRFYQRFCFEQMGVSLNFEKNCPLGFFISEPKHPSSKSPLVYIMGIPYYQVQKYYTCLSELNYPWRITSKKIVKLYNFYFLPVKKSCHLFFCQIVLSVYQRF